MVGQSLTTYKTTAFVQRNHDGGGLDSGISVGNGKNLSDSLIYFEAELTGFLNEFVAWYERKSGVKNALKSFGLSN